MSRSFYSIMFLISIFTALQARAEDGLKIEAHGLLSSSLYYQSSPELLLNGQGPLMAIGTNSGPVMAMDVRQSRLGVSITGGKIMNGFTPKAVIEADFFGLDSAGSYGQVSALSRLRLAYLELERGNTKIRIGQDWQLMKVNLPVSLSHIAYTFFGAGFIGWRDPGISGYQTFDLGKSKLEVSAQILKADWESPSAFGLTNNGDKNIDAGALSGLPGVEGRVRWTLDTTAEAYFVGHWNRVAASHVTELAVQNADTPTGTNIPSRSFDVYALKIGGRYQFGKFSVLGEIYQGKNLGPLLGNLLQFPVQTDIREAGGWAQVGYAFLKNWDAYLSYGSEQPYASDANKANSMAGAKEARMGNTMEGLLVQYHEGAFAVGPEIFLMNTALIAKRINVQQYTVSANYSF